MFSHSDPIVLFRMAERLALTIVVLLVAAIVMVGFWRTVQKIDVSGAGKLGLGGSVVFSTPVLVLLAIVGYAYVSLSNPVSLTSAAPRAAGTGGDEVASAQATQSFLGSTAQSDAVTDDPYARTVAQRRIRSLNCLSRNRELSPRLQDDLVDTKLALMAPVWDEAWGAFDAFAAWARATSDTAPPAAARAMFEESHVVC